jgi:putative phosphoribosyl transferase
MTDEDGTFADRREAGIVLGKLLEKSYKDRNSLVLGIPRGGVLVAGEVAKILNAELSVIITKKLPHPLQEELAIGACAEDGSVFLTALAKGLDKTTVRNIVEAQHAEIQSRIDRFRHGHGLPEMRRRRVLLVDDGIATGSTIVPAIKLCKSRHALAVVVVAPVSGHQYVHEIDALADDVVIAMQPPDFYAVGQAYADFHHLSDEEVTSVLDDYSRFYQPAGGAGKPI